MPDSYPIIQVEPEWVLEPEDMGTKEKFWYRNLTDGGREWLFKNPRENTGEHWAEKIAAEVANVLGIPHATVELAEFQFHGNQLLARTTRGYDPTAKRGEIFWSEEAEPPPSPLELVRRAVVGHPFYFGPALERLAELRDALVTEIVGRVPSDWMSLPARAFAIKLITYHRNQLLELNR